MIPNQEHQKQIISSPKDTSIKNGKDFLQKMLTQDGIANTPKNDKMPNNQIVISVNNPSPIFQPQPQAFQMQNVQTPFQGNISNFSNMCDSPDFMDTQAEKILQQMEKEL